MPPGSGNEAPPNEMQTHQIVISADGLTVAAGAPLHDQPNFSDGIVLSLADAAVEVSATDKRERLLAYLGELHLEQSILDLGNVYCDKEV